MKEGHKRRIVSSEKRATTQRSLRCVPAGNWSCNSRCATCQPQRGKPRLAYNPPTPRLGRPDRRRERMPTRPSSLAGDNTPNPFLSRDPFGLPLGDRLPNRLLTALGRRLLEGLQDLLALRLLLPAGPDLHHLLASSSVYSRNSSGPSTTLAPKASATRTSFSPASSVNSPLPP